MAFLALMFFTCGFALGITSLLVPVLKVSLSGSSMEAYMLIGATFLPFLIFGYPAGILISKIGYWCIYFLGRSKKLPLILVSLFPLWYSKHLFAGSH